MRGRERRYRLYIDESGDHVLRDEKTLARPERRYLTLMGCWFVQRPDYLRFRDGLEALKQRHFPHDPDDSTQAVVLHRTAIRYCQGPFRPLRQDDARRRFDADLLELLRESEFVLFGIVMDKLGLRRQYVRAYHPYHVAVTFMLQRYCGYLNRVHSCGDVMAESRGATEDTELKAAYERIYQLGDVFGKRSADSYQAALTSKRLKLKKKTANIAGLQLADILAVPLWQYVLQKSGRAGRTPTEFEEAAFAVLEAKFNRKFSTGQTEGYGWRIFP